MEPKLKIDWDSAPAGFPFWCEAIGTSSSDYSGWHRQNENGDYVDLNGYIWSKVAEGKHFRVYRRPEPAPLITALGDCVSVMERELGGLAVIQPELKAAREALAAADAAPTAWAGEGLPPAGIEFETLWDSGQGTYAKAFAIGLNRDGSLVYQLLETPSGERVGEMEAEYRNDTVQGYPTFRPLRTPEQIAAEEREKAVHQMGQDAGFSGSVQQCYERLYDLGYRKDPRTADLLRALKDIATASEQSTALGLKQLAASTLAVLEGGAQ